MLEKREREREIWGKSRRKENGQQEHDWGLLGRGRGFLPSRDDRF
jgi:hypothetical protein